MSRYFAKINPLIAIFLVAMLLRLGALGLSYFHGANGSYAQFVNLTKMDGYYEIANVFLGSRTFGMVERGVVMPNSNRTPGYPALLALFLWLNKNIWLFLVLQIVVASLLPLVAHRVLTITKLFSARTTMLVAIAMAIDPVGIYLSIKLLTETVFTLLVLLAIGGLTTLLSVDNQTRWSAPWRAALVGFFVGLATLVRPTLLYLPALAGGAAAAYALVKKNTVPLYRVLLATAVFLAVVFPWLHRNYDRFGVVGYTSMPEQVLFYQLAPSVLGVASSRSLNQARLDFFSGTNFSISEINLDRAAAARATSLAILKKYPSALVRVCITSFVTFFTHDGLLDVFQSAGYFRDASAHASLVFLMRGCVRLWWAVCCLGSVYYWYAVVRQKQYSPAALVLGALVLYFAVTSLTNGFAINARFRYPIDFAILAFGIEGCNIYKKRLKKITP